jgi:hypothetical protein
MSVTGKIKNGVVVLPPGTVLPEGADVTVQTMETDDSLSGTAAKLAKPRSHLPDDYALNHGHYVSGEPKK